MFYVASVNIIICGVCLGAGSLYLKERDEPDQKQLPAVYPRCLHVTAHLCNCRQTQTSPSSGCTMTHDTDHELFQGHAKERRLGGRWRHRCAAVHLHHEPAEYGHRRRVHLHRDGQLRYQTCSVRSNRTIPEETQLMMISHVSEGNVKIINSRETVPRNFRSDLLQSCPETDQMTAGTDHIITSFLFFLSSFLFVLCCLFGMRQLQTHHTAGSTDKPQYFAFSITLTPSRFTGELFPT